MKQITFLFFQILFISTFGQTVFEGKIIDKNSKESIPFVNIFVQNSTQGVISNEDGIFKFYIPNGAEKIEISHIGYKSQIFDVNLIQKESTTIFLETDEMALEEVIVTNIPINQILARILSNSKNQLVKKHQIRNVLS